MDLSKHPSEWKITTPYLIFACYRRVINSDAIKKIAELSPPMELTEYVWFRVNVMKKSGSTVNLEDAEVCQKYLRLLKLWTFQIEVEDLNDPNDIWISSLRRARSLYDQTVVFVRAKNPRVFRRGVSIRISIREDNKRIPCEAKCNMVKLKEIVYNDVFIQGSENGTESGCDGTVFLHERPQQSQEKVYASDPSYLQLLGWKMMGMKKSFKIYKTFFQDILRNGN